MLRFISAFLLLWCCVNGNARTIHSSQNRSLKNYFVKKNTTYTIRKHYKFNDTLYIPVNCKLVFKGGSLSGPIVFNNTILSGKVNLKGASIHGTLNNNIFDASWVCYKDGISDDAPLINCMLNVCHHIFFPRGRYRLISAFDPTGYVDKELCSSIKCHIGISKSDIILQGEQGTVFVTDRPLGTICIFSQPNQIRRSVSGIAIEGITFSVKNNGSCFYEFMHTIKTIGVNGLLIENCKFDDFWGDAICLSHYGDDPKTGERTRNQNVSIIDNQIVGGNHYSNRNGISVINGKNVLIKGNTIKNTSRKDMPGGIDVEPNNSAYTIDSIMIQNNILEGIKGAGGAICIVLLRDNAPARNIEIKSNKIRKSSCGLTFVIKTDYSAENFIVSDNYVDKETKPYRFSGNGKSRNWKIINNTFERFCSQNIPGEITVNGLINHDKKHTQVPN